MPSGCMRSAAILIGASEFPQAKSLQDGGSSFMAAMERVRQQFVPFIGAQEFLLDLFDAKDNHNDQYEKIENFVKALAQHKQIENIFLLYIGHGGIGEADKSYYLTIQDTRANRQCGSSLKASELAKILRNHGKHLRRYIVLDACFSGAAAREFMGTEQAVVKEKIANISWNGGNHARAGTAILCAASKGDAALYLPHGTMFSDALLRVLAEGDQDRDNWLTFEDLHELVKASIMARHPDNAVMPEIHVPDQKHGMVHKVELLPNSAKKTLPPPGKLPLENFKSVEQRRKDLPKSLTGAITQCLNPSPQDRLQTAQALLVQLQNLGKTKLLSNKTKAILASILAGAFALGALVVDQYFQQQHEQERLKLEAQTLAKQEQIKLEAEKRDAAAKMEIEKVRIRTEEAEIAAKRKQEEEEDARRTIREQLRVSEKLKQDEAEKARVIAAAVRKAEAEKQLQILETKTKVAAAPVAPVELVSSDANWATIPAGSFQMGSDLGGDNEKPVHEVTVAAFKLMKHEVTRGEFAEFVNVAGYTTDAERNLGEKGCRIGKKHSFLGISYVTADYKVGTSWRDPKTPQNDNDPVVCISYNDAKAYARWKTDTTRKQHRLPTEAEWEYAARAGATSEYFWGDAVGKNNANCDGCGSQWDNKSAPVGSFPANKFGLYDMHGNEWEWVEDCYRENYEDTPRDGSARSDATCEYRVLRGGGWGNEPPLARLSYRSRVNPVNDRYRVNPVNERYNGVGFRLAREN